MRRDRMAWIVYENSVVEASLFTMEGSSTHWYSPYYGSRQENELYGTRREALLALSEKLCLKIQELTRRHEEVREELGDEAG